MTNLLVNYGSGLLSSNTKLVTFNLLHGTFTPLIIDSYQAFIHLTKGAFSKFVLKFNI